MGWAKRVDGNHRQVADALRDLGWQVIDTSRLPHFVDLVCWHTGRQSLRLVEVKDGKAAAHTKAQERLIGQGWPIVTVRTVDDVAKL